MSKKVQISVPQKLIVADVYGEKTPNTTAKNIQKPSMIKDVESFDQLIVRSTDLLKDQLLSHVSGVGKDMAIALIGQGLPMLQNDLIGLKDNVVGALANATGLPTSFLDKSLALGKHPSRQAVEGLLGEQFPKLKILKQSFDERQQLKDEALSTIRRVRDIDTTTEVLNLVDQVFATNTQQTYVNLSSEFKALSAMISVAFDYDVPEAIDKAISKAQQENKEALSHVAFYNAALKGNWDILKQYSVYPLEGILSRYPSIVRNILENYKLEGRYTQAHCQELIALLDKLDPKWFFDGELYHYDNLCYASDDAAEVLGLSEELGIVVVAARQYSPVNVDLGLTVHLDWVPLL